MLIRLGVTIGLRGLCTQHIGEGEIARPLTTCKRDRDVTPRQVKEDGDVGWPDNDGQMRVENLAQ